MTTLLLTIVCVAGGAYAACLWFVARHVARRRALALGTLPVWLLVLGAAAAGGTAVLDIPRPSRCRPALRWWARSVCGVVDARTGFIFDALSAIMAAVSCITAGLNFHAPDGFLAAAIVGAALGSSVSAHRSRGIGLGDVKLGAAVASGTASSRRL